MTKKRRKMRPVEDRVWEKVNKNGPIPIFRPQLGNCWVWTRSLNSHGYAETVVDGKCISIHALTYKWEYGEIPFGYQHDHLCRNRACVRPSHIEPVTVRENILRGIGPCAENARKTHCAHGHEYNEENTIHVPNGRDCRVCARERTRQYNVRKRLASTQVPA